MLKGKKPVPKEKTPAVLLYSGGFDSNALSEYLYDTRKDLIVHHLHFLYGAPNEKQQLECTEKVCARQGSPLKVIRLPAFDWTKGDFFKGTSDYEKSYVEYRNLVFLAYAVSYAQSIGATEIFIALLNGYYLDGSASFVRGLNSAIKKSGIKIVAPFIKMSKEQVMDFALDHTENGFILGNFFSCDNPKPDGSPCGVCERCLAFKPAEDYYKEHYLKKTSEGT